MADYRAVLEFWLQELEPKNWYQGGDALDADCRDRFGGAWDDLVAGHLERWRTCPDGALAYILVADQLSRNMHRGKAEAFATDRLARAATIHAMGRGWDQQFPEETRQFFYLPLEHSESLQDQARAVRLILTRMPENGSNTLLHARAHRAIIRSFGRFPARNAALGRMNSAAEEAYLASNGYAQLLKDLAPQSESA